jgi:ubiquinone/menaquinone biosynthesis C-methylase UbiE
MQTSISIEPAAPLRGGSATIHAQTASRAEIALEAEPASRAETASELTVTRRFYSDEHAEWQEDVHCPWCQSPERSLVLEATDRVYHRPGRYRVERCAGCELMYVSPRPTFEALEHHYPADYFCYHAPEDMPRLLRGSISAYVEDLCKRRLAFIEQGTGKLSRGTTVLDVGCGVGDLLTVLERERGCVVNGVDFKASAVASARENRGLNIEHGTLFDPGYESESFDLVTMMEYLEHERDPRSVLTEARRVLKPGGRLALEIPHPTAWPARLFGNNWWNLHVPRHLVLFSPETVKRALTELGFEEIQIQPFTYSMNMGTNLYQALGFPYRSNFHYVFTVISTILSLPFEPFARWMPEFLFVTARVPGSAQ